MHLPKRSIRWRPISWASVIGLLISFAVVGLALAHSRYVRSTPGDGAVIASAPAQVDIWFSQDLFKRKGENVIHVSGPDGAEVSVGDTQIEDDDRTHLWVELKPNLPSGLYRVTWKNVSLEDGHPFEGAFNFTVDPTASATPAPIVSATPSGPAATQPAAAPTKSVPASGPCGLGAAPMVGWAGFVLIKRSRRKRLT